MSLIAHKPSQELVDLVQALGGKWHGPVATCRCPAHADNDPSLSLRQGDRGILVTCFAGCTREDVLRELTRVRITQHGTPPETTNRAGAGNAVRIWNEAVDVRNTLAQHHLARRHFTTIPPDVRFHPRCPYLPKPHTQFLPALLVAVRERRQLTAIQRIFLDPAKADYTHKAMLGTPRHGAWQGGYPRRILGIAEGFEDARAFTLLRNIPCWASLGARRFDQLIIPDHVEILMLAHDNDAEGLRAANRAAERYARPGLAIHHAPPSANFGDWADLLAASMEQGSNPAG
ncbi:toprim domain-containing protein (plasmid) [Sphingobium fuliginis]|jgi:hypothetical protein|uniref:Toprim domain-containing protein n=1 Tax=Sphingobium fuliginis (strain ATCC 27551) TaxID=336203 RepID=A0A7M2GP92_SPHSA|nr:toprim domain-containing protein [Sphingobium fuliginis]QOT74560.1 toprim domain-containing protein [Sphingobium fuliginis]